MDAVIPAAGEGTRLGELTEDRPKGLVEVAGRPLLAYAFDAVIDVGANRLVVVIGYRGEEIVARFGDAYEGVPITYVHQRERLGLAHAVSTVSKQVDGPFIVHNGDNVIQADLEAVHDHVGADGVDGVLLVEEVTREEAQRTGVVTTESGVVTGLIEKPAEPPSTLSTTGYFVLPEATFHACALVQPGATGEQELSTAIDLLVRAGYTIVPVAIDGWRVNVNRLEDVQRVERLLGDSTSS